MKAPKRFFPTAAPLAGLVLAIIGTSCATQKPRELLQAQQLYMQARQDPKMVNNAPVSLHEAGTIIEKAQDADDREEAKHLAYLAEKKVAVARAEADQKLAERESQQLLEERDKVLLQGLEKELAELKAQKTERGYVMTLGNVLFDVDRASLTAGAQQILYRLVTFLREHPKRSVIIEGYTDSSGSHAYNMALSERRAQSVQAFLLANGISPDRVTAQGFGESNPVASNSTQAGRLQNRRVEVVISEEGGTAGRP